MSRRRTPVAPFADTIPLITKMEAAAVYRTVTLDFTLQDVVDWMLPTGVQKILRDAYHLAEKNSDTWSVGQQRLGTYQSPVCAFSVRVGDLEMLCPSGDDPVSVDSNTDHPIYQTMVAIEKVVSRFSALTKVVNWLNDAATPAAARYYIPTLGSLLPAGHPFHRPASTNFREPQGLAAMSPLIREASSTIAMGLLSDPDGTKLPGTGAFQARVYAGAPVVGRSPQWFNLL